MNERPSLQPTRLSKEPGFVSLDLFRPPYAHKLPQRVPGLLAFLHAEDGEERVLRLFLCEDLAKDFARSRPFCGQANKAAYREFACPKDVDFELHKREQSERLRTYAQLIERYRIRQTAFCLDEFTTVPPT